MKISIGAKIFLGNLPLIVVIVVTTVVALLRVNEAHDKFTHVLDIEIQQKTNAQNMIAVLRDRESNAMRYLILQSEDMLNLYEQRNSEYDSLLNALIIIDPDSLSTSIKAEDSIYNEMLAECRKLIEESSSDQYKQKDTLRVASYIKQGETLQKVIARAEENQKHNTESAVLIISKTFRVITIVAVGGLILAMLISAFISGKLIRSVKKLKSAAAKVAQGEFKELPSVISRDELGELSHSFNHMANRLIVLEETYKDASPLTRLPGGVAIETVTQTRIDQEIPFAFIMLDLDNFKPFNDRYGYSRGNQIIKHTAEILLTTTEHFGTEHDFVGHIGGDDFVVITTPDKLELICSTIISRFDHDIISFYDEEDKSNGKIISQNRQGETQSFPIMSISISAVNSELSEVANYIHVGEIIAELKKYAKSFEGSNFVIDRRNERGHD